MKDAFRVVGRSFRDWWDEMFLMVGVNLVWGVLALAVVTLFPGWMGAFYLTREKALGHRVEFDLFWQGFRQYFGKSWALGAICLVVTLMLVVNIWFYAQMANALVYLTIVWIYILVMWVCVLTYVFPMALVQEDKSIRLTFRNAVLLAAGRPLFTLVVGIINVLLLAVSIIVPPLLLLLYIPLSALVGNHATIDSLEYVERRQAQLAGEEEPHPKPATRSQSRDRRKKG